MDTYDPKTDGPRPYMFIGWRLNKMERTGGYFTVDATNYHDAAEMALSMLRAEHPECDYHLCPSGMWIAPKVEGCHVCYGGSRWSDE